MCASCEKKEGICHGRRLAVRRGDDNNQKFWITTGNFTQNIKIKQEEDSQLGDCSSLYYTVFVKEMSLAIARLWVVSLFIQRFYSLEVASHLPSRLQRSLLSGQQGQSLR